jgi:hypothetical protein
VRPPIHAAAGFLQKYYIVAVRRNRKNLKDMYIGHRFAQSISRQQSTLIAVPYRLEFMVWVPESKGKFKNLLV